MKDIFQRIKTQIINQKHNFFWLTAFFSGAFIWLLFFTPIDGLWYDECFTLYHSQGASEDIINVSKWDSNPPLYLMIVKKWLELVGYSEFKLRLLSLLFSSGFIAIGTVWLKNNFSKTVSYFTFVLLLLSEVTIEYAHEARVYSFLFFLMVISSLLLIKLIQKPNILFGIGIGVINSVVFFSHYIEGIIVLIQSVFLLFVLFSKDFTLKTKLQIITYYSIGVAIFLYYVYQWKDLFLTLIKGGGNKIAPSPQIADIPRVFYELLNHNVIFTAGTILILLFGCYQLSKKSKTTAKNQKWIQIYFFILVFLSFIVIYAVSYKAPMFSRRYLMYTLFSLFALISIIIDKLENTKLKYGIISVLILFFVLNNSFQTSKQMQVKNAVNFIKKHKTSKTLVIVQSKDIVPNFALYYNYSIFKKYWLIEEQLTKENIVAVNTFDEFLKSINFNNYEKIFLFQVFENSADPRQSVFNYLKQELQMVRKTNRYRGINLFEFSNHNFSYKTSNSLKNGKFLQLNYYKQKVASDPEWLKYIQTKAKEQNISLDSALTNECLWLISEDENKLNALN
jgi:uncharacterized membrane protein